LRRDRGLKKRNSDLIERSGITVLGFASKKGASKMHSSTLFSVVRSAPRFRPGFQFACPASVLL
jgi:hypothetical protein